MSGGRARWRGARLDGAVALATGLVFAIGLVVAGMTMPSKVRGFLDFTGAWDPTLVFVMGGAIGVHALAYRMVRGRAAPLLGDRFHLPTREDLDARLMLGAAVFGIGWGLGGYCPGPALTSIVSGSSTVLVFVAAMLATGWLVGRLEARRPRAPAKPRTVLEHATKHEENDVSPT